MQDNALMNITNPDGNAQVAQAMHDYVVQRERELTEEFNAISAKITPFTFAETKNDWTRLKKIDGELKSIAEKLEARALEYAKADTLLFQVNATRKNLAALYKENWAKYTELRDADKPKAKPREYLLEVYMTDDEFVKTLKGLAKSGAKYRYVEVGSSDDQPSVDRIFEVIESHNAK